MSSENKNKPLSRRSIACKECGTVFERFENLKVHYERKHPGKACMAKGQSSISTFVAVGDDSLSEKDNTTQSVPIKTQKALASTDSTPIISKDVHPLSQLSPQILDEHSTLQTPPNS